jgi:hypothetical protein
MPTLLWKSSDGDSEGVAMDHPDFKHCPICNNDLPVGDFGLCRARKDGRNLYCMSCIREKVKESRRAFKEYKTIRKNREIARYLGEEEPVIVSAPKPEKQSPVDRVRVAIKAGRQTQREIAQQTKLTVDQVGEAIATLMLWNHEIKSEIKGETRIYFFVEQSEPLPIPDRKPVVLAPFHELQAFMPGRKRAVV